MRSSSSPVADDLKVPLTSAEAQGPSINNTTSPPDYPTNTNNNNPSTSISTPIKPPPPSYGSMQDSDPQDLNITLENSSDDEDQNQDTDVKYNNSNDDDDDDHGAIAQLPRQPSTGGKFIPNTLPSARLLRAPSNNSEDGDLTDGAFTPRFGGSGSGSGGINPNAYYHNEGYCLVFTRKTKYHEVYIDGDKLKVQIRTDITDEEKEGAEKVKIQRGSNLLKHFKRTGIQYTMKVSEPDRMWIFVIVSISHDLAEQFADHKDLPVQIDPTEAITVGRQSEDFLLAQRTCLGGDDDKMFISEKVSGQEFEKLNIEDWEYIHIAYESSIDDRVYKRHGIGNQRNLLNNTLFLRILFELLTEDASMGGAGFKLSQFLRDRNHPLSAVFALNMVDDDGSTIRPSLSKDEMYYPQKPSVWSTKTDAIRSYYGELVSFYFAFLQHYTLWLWPLAIIGSIYEIIQLATGEIAFAGSISLVFIALIWATVMIEHWYRREKWLQYKWGVMTYTESEVPRPSFHGRYTVSPGKGTLVETYESYFKYYTKIIFSTSTMTMCIAIVIVVVWQMWTLKNDWGESTEISIGIGILNSIQILIFNIIYTKLAAILNEFEGHRLEQEYYNHLVLKKIVFYVVNSFNSLFYLAFYKSGFTNNEERLESVRTQLLTLFLTAIFWQNFMEIALPKIWAAACKKVIENKQREIDEREAMADKQIAPTKTLFDEKDTLNGSGGDVIKKKHKQSEDIPFHALEVSSEVWSDIEKQIMLTVSPDVLSNTSEIVIQYGYIMLFVLVFPAMPLFALINNYFEVRVDIYNLLNCRRPIPYAASGIGVWKLVISAFGIIAVFTNMAVVTWRTDTVKNIFGDDNEAKLNENKITFFFVISFILLFFMFLTRFAVPDMDQYTFNAIERQEQCERHLLLNSVRQVARQKALEKHMKLMHGKSSEKDKDN